MNSNGTGLNPRPSPLRTGLFSALACGLSCCSVFSQTSGNETGPSEFVDASTLRLDPGEGTAHQFGVTADYLFGSGYVTVPFLFGLAPAENAFQGGTVLSPSVSSPDRDSDYFGVSGTYSYRQAWFFDFSYSSGDSSGTVMVPLDVSRNSRFTISDSWYQGYVRYTFPKLRGKPFSAYVRAGITYIQADLEDQTFDSVNPNDANSPSIYTQATKTDEIQGNLGFGVAYSIPKLTTIRRKVAIQFEGEGFFGHRDQSGTETWNPTYPDGVPFETDGMVYGGLGRLTVHGELGLGSKALFRLFADVGVQGRFTVVDYPSRNDPATFTTFNGATENELLWGPYVKVGFKYSF